MLACSHACAARDTLALVNLYNLFPLEGACRAGLNAALAFTSASTACAFAVFPAALLIVYNNGHLISRLSF